MVCEGGKYQSMGAPGDGRICLHMSKPYMYTFSFERAQAYLFFIEHLSASVLVVHMTIRVGIDVPSSF